MMTPRADASKLEDLLQETLAAARDYLASLPTRDVTAKLQSVKFDAASLPKSGLGAQEALRAFRATYESALSASPGPRYLGFVTGGTTPAALAGDWLTAAYDQNVSHNGGSVAAEVERQTVALLRELFGLPQDFSGVFVSGATMANLVGLATARQWAALRDGVDVAELGVAAAPTPLVLAATPHASIGKALAILGMGRSSIKAVACLDGREAMDPDALELALQGTKGKAAIVVASAGTVNTTDFDDLKRIGALCRLYGAWLHVDGAFGLFAAVSPKLAPFVEGIEQADSIATDCHKWLNVPYDSGMIFTRHPSLQKDVFKAVASYLGPGDDPLHYTPENSRRFRALSAWMTLMAYGRDGYRDLVERNCAQAARLAELLAASGAFTLLRPTSLNVVCFRLSERVVAAEANLAALTRAFLVAVNRGGGAFLTPTSVFQLPAIRAAFSGWSTTEAEVEAVAQILISAAQKLES